MKTVLNNKSYIAEIENELIYKIMIKIVEKIMMVLLSNQRSLSKSISRREIT